MRSLQRKKILTLVTMGLSPDEEALRELEGSDRHPRALLFGTALDSDILDEHYLNRLPVARRLFYKLFPGSIGQLLEAFLVRNKYEAVITWSDKLTIFYALMLKLTKSHGAHIGMMTWLSSPKKGKLLVHASGSLDRIILWSSVQKRYAETVLHIAPERIALVGRRVDHRFWRPTPGVTDMICTVGVENRDYPTLVRAMEGLNIRCHIAAGEYHGERYKSVRALDAMGSLPDNITVGKLDYEALRKLYVRSRFVVIPLHPSDTDHGVTTMEEAMAMGKAVICSRTSGQVDHLKDGVTGIFVSPHDAGELRDAILYLWNHPEIADSMGREGRRYIEAHHTLDQFIESVRVVVEDVIKNHRGKTKRKAVSCL